VRALGGVASAVGEGRGLSGMAICGLAATLLNHCFLRSRAVEAPGSFSRRSTRSWRSRRRMAVWRNFYLTGAMELREGVKPPVTTPDSG